MKKILLLFLLAQTVILPQNLDSLFNRFISIREGSHSKGETPEIIKCGTEITHRVMINFNNFTVEQQNLLKPYFDRPNLPETMVTPGGFFRIHYATTSTDAIGYDINQLAAALDSSYNFEINFLGYPAPPSDNGEGGDNRYDIYVANIGNTYGYTSWNFATGTGPSYISIHNTFGSFYTHGIDAARVTVAHEFHHAIQVGGYSYRDEDAYFHELTSTSMEEFVFDDVNDYYAYIPGYFNNPSASFSRNNLQNTLDGYDQVLWNIYLQKRFGYGIIKKQWELMPTMKAVQAINAALRNPGNTGGVSTSFGEEYNRYGVWCYFTKNRADTNYFEEGANYPLLHPDIIVNAGLPFDTTSFAAAMSNNYLMIRNRENADTVFTVITNANIPDAAANNGNMYSYTYAVSNQPGTGYTEIVSGSYYTKLAISQPAFWLSSVIFNSIPVGSAPIQPVDSSLFLATPFPSPYRFGNQGHQNLYIPFNGNTDFEVDLNVFTLSMNTVYSGTAAVTKAPNGQLAVAWNPRSQRDKISSGIYIYTIKFGGNVTKGKIVIFNE